MPTPSSRDIAERAGVSLETARQILGGRGQRYGAATRDRVERLARDLGYRPNAAALAISTGRFGCLAMLTSAVPERAVWVGDFWIGLTRALAARDHHLAVVSLPDDELVADEAAPKLLRQQLADGLLINGADDLPPAFAAAIVRHRIPHAWINRRVPGAACVAPDDAGAGALVARALLSAGHRRIAYTSSLQAPDASDEDRWRGCRDACAAAGLRARRVQGEAPPQDRAAWMGRCRALLGDDDRPSAIVAYDPRTAYPLSTVAAGLGLRLPQDLSLVTFAGEIAAEIGPVLSTCIIPYRALGAAAAEAGLAAIADHDGARFERLVPFTQLVGATIAPPP